MIPLHPARSAALSESSARLVEIARVPFALLEQHGMWRVVYPPYDVLVVLHEGGLFAIEDACNHAGASLRGGDIVDGCIECPAHGYLFDLRTGDLHKPKGLCGPQRVFQVGREGNEVVVFEAAATRLVDRA